MEQRRHGSRGIVELFYTPQLPDGSIDITKAVRVSEQFQVTRQFWAYAADNGMLSDVRGFLNAVPHVSFVQGAERVEYLRRRHRALAVNPLFARNEWVQGGDEFARRLPYMAAKRDLAGPAAPIALSWATDGTDVDFGALSRQLIGYGLRNGTTALFGHEVRNLTRQRDGSWTLTMRNRRRGDSHKLNAAFVFVGAGGQALPLLQKSGIKEIKGFGGFPVGGRFLRSGNPAVTSRHRAKVYGSRPRRAGDDGGPPGHPDRQWQAMADVRSVCRLVAKVPQARAFQRSAAICHARQSFDRDRGRARSTRAGQLSDRSAADVEAHACRGITRIRAQRSRFRLEPDDLWSTGPGDATRRTPRGPARVRYHGAHRGGRQHRRTARRIAGGLDRGDRDARRAAALLSRPVPGVAADVQGDDSVVGRHLVHRAGALRGVAIVDHQVVGAGVVTAALHRMWAKDLDVATLYALLKLRVEVFVVEQAAPYPELDGRDLLAETRHFWLEAPDGR